MRKLYSGGTINQAAVDADPDLQNSTENDFSGVTFSGTIVGVNFSRVRFRNTCVFTGVTFQDCNMMNLAPDGNGVNPGTNGATLVNCPIGDRPRGLNDGVPTKRNDLLTVTAMTSVRTAMDTAVSGGGDPYQPQYSYI